MFSTLQKQVRATVLEMQSIQYNYDQILILKKILANIQMQETY